MLYVFTEMQSERHRVVKQKYVWWRTIGDTLSTLWNHILYTPTVYICISMTVCTSVYRKMFTSHACSLCIPTFLVASNSLDSLPDPYTCGPSTFSKLLNVSHHHKNKGSTSTTPTPQKRAHTILNEVLGILTISQRGSADNRQKNADRQPSQPIH